ncbi:hypothetical protein MPDQ_000362 [Monascus purpureus]|uniref:VOC domain-containing protein n=1 Tax=Monascus purpureus TaxID=5098 RepID=A0A507QPZ9_MONPU|nr:hypothetical protein MPDQ_000362 [Monascus purpureus]
MPVSHLTLTVSHLPTSTSFFLSCLQPLGYQFIGRHDDYIGFGQERGQPADFWITEQKPGSPAGAAHVAFPAPSKEAVGDFFIHALKAGGKIHGEPKTRDSLSGYYSAAVIDFDGNSIEAVYRPGEEPPAAPKSEVRGPISEARGPTLALLEDGSRSVVSKAPSKVSSVKPPESVASFKSAAKSEANNSRVSKAPTIVQRTTTSSSSSTTTRETQSSGPTYIIHTTQQQPPKSDGDTTAKTVVGTLLGAAAGAAIAYTMAKADSGSSSDSSNIPSQGRSIARELLELALPPRNQSQALPQPPMSAPMQQEQYRAIEAPSPGTYYPQQDARSTVSRSYVSKNPHATTIYEGSEYFPPGAGGSIIDDNGDDGNGRRFSSGSVYSSTRDMPLRAIEYPPPLERSKTFPCNPSTFISSFVDKPRTMDQASSVHSSSTMKAPSKVSNHSIDRLSHHSHSRNSHHSSRHSSTYHHHQASSSYSSPKSQAGGSTASSIHTARHVPLPDRSVASYRSKASAASAYQAPIPENADASTVFLDAVDVDPEDAESRHSRRSHYTHRSSHSHANSHTSRRSSKFDEPVKPSDSVSQVSSVASYSSQRTIKADGGASKVGSRVSSRRGSQVA